MCWEFNRMTSFAGTQCSVNHTNSMLCNSPNEYHQWSLKIVFLSASGPDCSYKQLQDVLPWMEKQWCKSYFFTGGLWVSPESGLETKSGGLLKPVSRLRKTQTGKAPEFCSHLGWNLSKENFSAYFAFCATESMLCYIKERAHFRLCRGKDWEQGEEANTPQVFHGCQT